MLRLVVVRETLLLRKSRESRPHPWRRRCPLAYGPGRLHECLERNGALVELRAATRRGSVSRARFRPAHGNISSAYEHSVGLWSSRESGARITCRRQSTTPFGPKRQQTMPKLSSMRMSLTSAPARGEEAEVRLRWALARPMPRSWFFLVAITHTSAWCCWHVGWRLRQPFTHTGASHQA